VGNGPSIKVWEDNWLPHPPIRKQNAVEVLKVNELIVKYTNSWKNKAQIDSIFEENTALCGGLALTVFNTLPTRLGLSKKKIPVDPICSICQHEEESTTHILWECPLARNVWALVP
jgi:hypothetical protein